MNSRIILGIGSGRCGTRSLADVLNRQPGCHATHDRPASGDGRTLTKAAGK